MKKSLAFAGLALICATPALADNTDTQTVTVSGNIVAPLTLAVDNNLTMATIVRPKTGGADNTLAMTCASATPSYVYSAGATPFAAGSTSETGIAVGSKNLVTPAPAATAGTCAKLTVSGQTGYFHQTSSTTPTLSTGSGVTFTASNCSRGATGVAITGVAASDAIYCGASISVTDLATATYTGSFSVTVTYD